MSRESTLAVLIADLTDAVNADFIGRDEYTRLFNRAVTTLNLDVNEVARICMTSRLIVERWKSGANTPHRFVRSAVFRALLTAANTQDALRRSVDQAKKGQTIPRPDESRLFPVTFNQTGLAGKRAMVVVSEATDEVDNPADLPEGTRDVIILDDTPNPHHTLRVHPVGDPSYVALVVHDQLALYGGQ